MADWQTPFATLTGALTPTSDYASVLTVPTSLLAVDYHAGRFGPFVYTQAITATTAPSPTASYTATPIVINGMDASSNAVDESLVFGIVHGPETHTTRTLFARITHIAVPAQLDANGFFQFGTVHVLSPSEIDGANAALATLSAAGAAYDARVKDLKTQPHAGEIPGRLAAGTSPKVWKGKDVHGQPICSWHPIPFPPTGSQVTADDIYRACRYIALLQLPSPWILWPTNGPPFGPEPSNADLDGQLNYTWPVVQAFLASQASLPPAVSAFVNATMLPLVAAGRAWAQYLRDMPQLTWAPGASP